MTQSYSALLLNEARYMAWGEMVCWIDCSQYC